MPDNAAAFAALDAFTEKLRRLESINEDAAKDVADGFKAKVEENVAAQVDPYGHAWQSSADGRAVLTHAAAAVQTRAVGTTITQTLTGVETRHHVGSARGYHGGSAKLGGFRRAIIPFSKLPGPFVAVIRDRLSKRFNMIFKGGA